MNFIKFGNITCVLNIIISNYFKYMYILNMK